MKDKTQTFYPPGKWHAVPTVSTGEMPSGPDHRGVEAHKQQDEASSLHAMFFHSGTSLGNSSFDNDGKGSLRFNYKQRVDNTAFGNYSSIEDIQELTQMFGGTLKVPERDYAWRELQDNVRVFKKLPRPRVGARWWVRHHVRRFIVVRRGK
jgi:hypothetical protein